MKTKFRVFTALLLALMVLVSVLPLQAAAEIGQSGTATRAEAENTAEAALSVKPMLTPSYTPSASYRSGKYYTQLCNVSLTGNQRTDLVNVARSQLGYHEGDNTSQLHGESSGSSNYTEYGYWYGTQVQGHSGGSYYAWCAYFISWCARQAGIPTSIISNASYACAGSDNGDFKNLDFYNRGSYTPKVGDLVFFDWPGDEYHWDHVEIVIGVSSSEVTTLGGNTGDNNVKSRKWSLSNSNIRGYGVPKYTTGSTPSPDPTPTPAPSGGVQDLTNPKNPNKYSTPPSGTYLNVGDSGNYVRWLQACLNQCGYSCDVDGQFGYGTAEALKGFQRAYSLTVDGGFGPECRTKILEVLTVAAPTITTAYDANGTRVTISGSSGTTIFYTTNGSTPTESSNKYNGSFVLNGAATVKAVAMQNCRYNSHVSSYGITVTKHTVTFKDWNGTVLKTQSVYHTGAATAPANPTRTGYTFTGWDKAFTNVTANLVVTAQYSINTYTVTFKDWNGTVLKTQQVQYGGAATAPANPTRAGYTFTGWDKAFTNVTANLVVTAQYVQNEPVSTPVPSDAPQIVVESKTTSAGSTVAVNISIANNPGFVTMGIQVAYDSNLTLLSVSDTGLVPGQMFSTEIENPQPLYWANPTATADCTVNGKIATLTFKVADNAEEGEYHIRVSYDYDNYDIYNQSGEAVQFATVNGTLTVTDVVYGDVNGDGRVNNLDGMVLMRHLAKWPSYPASMISPGADVNADGRINNLDGMILMRHLAKWPAYATLPYSSQKGIVAVRPDNTTFENEPTIVVGNAEAAPGETVRIPIELANNPGVVVMGIMVGYDENLTLLGFEDTGLLPGQLHSTVIENPQPLFWGNTTSGNCTENGVIIYLEFKVADDAAPGTYSITVTYDYENYDIYNYDGEPIEFAIQNGAVTVAAAQPEMHTVTFKDWDGTVLKTQEVQHGGDAEAPADPTRVGYTFTGWDKEFTNITADLVVTAQYEINTYTVTFKDWDGTVLKTQQVQHGGDAEAPADPTRTGYTFTGWDKAFTNITADLVVTAQYEINTYTVTFKDWDGTELKTQEVQHGGDAEAPADPTRTGYTFTGWDKAFTNITADLVVTAQYEINTYTVTFKDWDGTVLKTQEVQYGGDAEAPADPTRVGYTFTGWDKAFTNITADLVVTAQYEMLGDVDGDGNVSMADALTILRMAMDILPVENQQIADVDGDGFITSMDALLALRFAMHIEQ
ncbi:MAG: InlB B-repeat-containing protein [Clostridium sp.]|nr:InlB B-repeat-containing protein [Clostridium sp.]